MPSTWPVGPVAWAAASAASPVPVAASRMRLPGAGAVSSTSRFYQIVRFQTAAPTGGLILPVLVYWRIRRPAVRDWLSGKEIATGRTRRFAVGITVAALVVVSGAGAAVALWPCSFPTPATGGLQQDQTSATTTARPTGHLSATDGVQLAYYAYVPSDPVASLVFYHGSGANSAAGYLPG